MDYVLREQARLDRMYRQAEVRGDKKRMKEIEDKQEELRLSVVGNNKQ